MQTLLNDINPFNGIVFLHSAVNESDLKKGILKTCFREKSRSSIKNSVRQ